jgi:hypothetical protein
VLGGELGWRAWWRGMEPGAKRGRCLVWCPGGVLRASWAEVVLGGLGNEQELGEAAMQAVGRVHSGAGGELVLRVGRGEARTSWRWLVARGRELGEAGRARPRACWAWRAEAGGGRGWSWSGPTRELRCGGGDCGAARRGREKVAVEEWIDAALTCGWAGPALAGGRL